MEIFVKNEEQAFVKTGQLPWYMFWSHLMDIIMP